MVCLLMHICFGSSDARLCRSLGRLLDASETYTLVCAFGLQTMITPLQRSLVPCPPTTDNKRRRMSPANYAPLGKFSDYLRLMFVAWWYYCDAKDCGGNSNSDDSDAIDRSLE